MSRRDGSPVLVRATGLAALERLPLNSSFGPDAVNESWLQDVLFRHPELLPLEQIEQGFAPLVSICREFPTRHGPIDNVFMTADGDLVIAEVKLWRNPEARRKVVAQALDYASCLFGMGYAEFEDAALRGQFGTGEKPRSLLDVFSEQDRPAESEFIDAVSRNLRAGRVVVLVVGDGIRTETERLSEVLQSHAGFRFTFALVELSLYRVPGTGERLVIPRTLARTALIERGVVRLEGAGITVAQSTANTPSDVKSKPLAGSISSDAFFEVMAQRDPRLPDRIRALLQAVQPLGVYPEFRRSLNLKWDAPSGKTVNLGYIQRDGLVWTGETGPALGEALSRRYNELLAQAWDGQAVATTWGDQVKWQVRLGEGSLKIEALGDRLGKWAEVLGKLLLEAAASEP